MDLGDNEDEVESRVIQRQEEREERIGRVIHHREVANSEWKEHLEHAQEFRHRYSDERRRAKEEYDKVKEGLLAEDKYVPHWTFDFAASRLPQDIEKPVAFDFNQLRHVRCFGVMDDGKRMQTNYLFWEYYTTGNANTTISLLDK